MQRYYVKPDYTVTTWELLKPYFEELKERKLNSSEELEKWLKDYSELGAVVGENMAWRYIRMTCDTTNTELRDRFNDFVQNIEPHMAPIANDLNVKLMASPYKDKLTKTGYDIYLRGIKNSIDLFREENIPLNTQLQELEQQFGEINGAQSIEHEGEKITLQKASVYLKDLDRTVRETVYKKVQKRRAEDEGALNDLFTKLINLRHQVSLNAGFKNYRDYKHQSLARFDYSVQDCLNFHEAVKLHAVPLINEHDKRRKEKLKLADYRPWDTSVDEEGLPPLKPFANAQELIDRTIECFNKLDPFFGECIDTMQKLKRLDLDSRLGKAPGGYQYPLYETDVPFIFMNSVGLHRDLVTMVHEGGHAIHSFLDFDLELVDFKSPPSEVAELASMSMELMSMEHWDVFFKNEDELKRAKRQQLESVMDTLPWIAAIDRFQHWIYKNPDHTTEQRYEEWERIIEDFGSDEINYKGLEDNLRRRWQVQLHLFEVPFYYIEYGFAQLGAIAVWRNYKTNPKKAVENYKKALALGYTKSIPKIYEAAGVKFDFSPDYIKELMDFVKAEYEKI
ncbi:M3 family oligoendopeptidase [Aurantibacillus circumpalustris]|uniref:M3 family oligoendopeptidase n=1 Tax=Aurantibacillus circumpalustris TaxID=3036359 RepID=UPI00295A9A0E|nr:M3 family oligoendopeptidase [Aurantibacillus circumpalustris]